MSNQDTNNYSACTYNILDPNNPFSNCLSANTPTNKQYEMNAHYLNNYNQYMSEIGGVNQNFINNIKQNIGTNAQTTNPVVGGQGDGTSNAITSAGFLSSLTPVAWNFTNGGVKLNQENNNVVTKRAQMDGVITFINSSKNLNNSSDSSFLYSAYFYVNVLWIILATTLIYYIFTEL